jgi:hypothetical protein
LLLTSVPFARVRSDREKIYRVIKCKGVILLTIRQFQSDM